MGIFQPVILVLQVFLYVPSFQDDKGPFWLWDIPWICLSCFQTRTLNLVIGSYGMKKKHTVCLRPHEVIDCQIFEFWGYKTALYQGFNGIEYVAPLEYKEATIVAVFLVSTSTSVLVNLTLDTVLTNFTIKS